MNFPVSFGLPQVILFLLFLVGVGLIISSAMSLRPSRVVETVIDRHGVERKRRRRRRFRWHHGAGGMVFLLIGIGILWLVSVTQAYIGLTREIRAARVHATPITNAKIPQMSVEITLYDDHQRPILPSNTYIVNGDQWMVQAEFIEVHPWLGVLGVHSGYKLVRLEGIFTDSDLERHQEHTVVDLNGGIDDFFKSVKTESWYSGFIKGIYGSATFVPADATKTYDVLVSQDAIKAELATSP
ncbi:MAG: hypothetical protein J2P36_13840 [Ktedonobacteraceae bacterium]|nr:hypothetical protein [Ktedonobacteraceae bacterium]